MCVNVSAINVSPFEIFIINLTTPSPPPPHTPPHTHPLPAAVAVNCQLAEPILQLSNCHKKIIWAKKNTDICEVCRQVKGQLVTTDAEWKPHSRWLRLRYLIVTYVSFDS